VRNLSLRITIRIELSLKAKPGDFFDPYDICYNRKDEEKEGKPLSFWDVDHVTELLRSFGWFGYIGGALLVFLQTLLPVIPFVVVAGANVLLFGFWGGFLVNYLFTSIGALTAFLFARYVGRAWVEKKLSKYRFLGVFNDKLRKHGLLFIALFRVMPILPSFVTNLGAAVSKVRTRDYLLGTLLGNAPMILIESLIGHDLLHFAQHKTRLIGLFILFIILLAIGTMLKNKWFPKRATH
jgi:uncharacterized membrane protein YdjX (TVP38/TMEM64 family)